MSTYIKKLENHSLSVNLGKVEKLISDLESLDLVGQDQIKDIRRIKRAVNAIKQRVMSVDPTLLPSRVMNVIDQKVNPLAVNLSQFRSNRTIKSLNQSTKMIDDILETVT